MAKRTCCRPTAKPWPVRLRSEIPPRLRFLSCPPSKTCASSGVCDQTSARYWQRKDSCLKLSGAPSGRRFESKAGSCSPSVATGHGPFVKGCKETKTGFVFVGLLSSCADRAIATTCERLQSPWRVCVPKYGPALLGTCFQTWRSPKNNLRGHDRFEDFFWLLRFLEGRRNFYKKKQTQIRFRFDNFCKKIQHGTKRGFFSSRFPEKNCRRLGSKAMSHAGNPVVAYHRVWQRSFARRW